MTNQMPELKPCPFCGGEPWVFESKYEDGVRLHNARCKSCHVAFDGCSTARIAREKWNTRADIAQKTVTREDVVALVSLYWDDSVPFRMDTLAEIRTVVSALIQSGIVKVKE